MINLVLTLALMTVALFGGSLQTPAFAAGTSTIQALWDDRAFLAEERIKNLDKLVKENAGEEYKYQMMLESGYACHADPARSKSLRETKGNNQIYRICINCGPKTGKDNFVLSYVYEANTGNLVSSQVESIPSNWTMMSFNGGKQIIVLSDQKNNKLVFDEKDPFNSYVMLSGKQN